MSEVQQAMLRPPPSPRPPSPPLPLRAYRLLSRAATPAVPLLLSYRLRRGREEAARLAERQGKATLARPSGPLVWMHGASIGEILALLPLIEHIGMRRCRVLLTSGTVTSAQLAAQRLPSFAIHQFVPLDAPRYVTRFFDHWRPDLALLSESDLWPNIIMESAARHIPLVLINGRVSERSFRRWRRLPDTIRTLLQHFDICLAQSADDERRYAELGAPKITTTGNIKLDAPAPPVDEGALAALKTAINGRPVIAATSTHPGEENAIVAAHRTLQQMFPSLLTIMAPRHPERGQAVAAIARDASLTCALRSAGALPPSDTDLYVVDTLGELGLIYRLAPIVFIGGSLVTHGGQNPIEAAKLGAAILHGPHVWNFAEIYAALDAANGAEKVSDAGKLAATIAAWLNDAARRQDVAAAAGRTVDALCGALERTLSALDPYFTALRPDHRPGDA
jgi:3-deoxy-D-manno-octulosonic-acid transferase